MSDGRWAVVTGGSRGIGRGIVRALAGRGFSVVVNFRADSGSAEAACREAIDLGAPNARPLRGDVADPDGSVRLVEEASAIAGRIDLWVNNAGVAPESRVDLLEATPESWDRVLGTNLRGPFFLTQSVARTMLQQLAAGAIEEPQIVFITSISARFASVNRGDYCVAKAGLSMVAQLFAARLAAAGIRVYEVRPGLIETDMTRGVHAAYDERIAGGLVPLNRWGTPHDVGLAVAAIADGSFRYATGAILDLDGGLGLRIL